MANLAAAEYPLAGALLMAVGIYESEQQANRLAAGNQAVHLCDLCFCDPSQKRENSDDEYVPSSPASGTDAAVPRRASGRAAAQQSGDVLQRRTLQTAAAVAVAAPPVTVKREVAGVAAALQTIVDALQSTPVKAEPTEEVKDKAADKESPAEKKRPAVRKRSVAATSKDAGGPPKKRSVPVHVFPFFLTFQLLQQVLSRLQAASKKSQEAKARKKRARSSDAAPPGDKVVAEPAVLPDPPPVLTRARGARKTAAAAAAQVVPPQPASSAVPAPPPAVAADAPAAPPVATAPAIPTVVDARPAALVACTEGIAAAVDGPAVSPAAVAPAAAVPAAAVPAAAVPAAAVPAAAVPPAAAAAANGAAAPRAAGSSSATPPGAAAAVPALLDPWHAPTPPVSPPTAPVHHRPSSVHVSHEHEVHISRGRACVTLSVHGAINVAARVFAADPELMTPPSATSEGETDILLIAGAAMTDSGVLCGFSICVSHLLFVQLLHRVGLPSRHTESVHLGAGLQVPQHANHDAGGRVQRVRQRAHAQGSQGQLRRLRRDDDGPAARSLPSSCT